MELLCDTGRFSAEEKKVLLDTNYFEVVAVGRYDLNPLDTTLSREHLRIRKVDSKMEIHVDVNGRNGAVLKRQGTKRVTSIPKGETFIAVPGDVIILRGFGGELRYRLEVREIEMTPEEKTAKAAAKNAAAAAALGLQRSETETRLPDKAEKTVMTPERKAALAEAARARPETSCDFTEEEYKEETYSLSEITEAEEKGKAAEEFAQKAAKEAEQEVAFTALFEQQTDKEDFYDDNFSVDEDSEDDGGCYRRSSDEDASDDSFHGSDEDEGSEQEDYNSDEDDGSEQDDCNGNEDEGSEEDDEDEDDGSEEEDDDDNDKGSEEEDDDDDDKGSDSDPQEHAPMERPAFYARTTIVGPRSVRFIHEASDDDQDSDNDNDNVRSRRGHFATREEQRHAEEARELTRRIREAIRSMSWPRPEEASNGHPDPYIGYIERVRAEMARNMGRIGRTYRFENVVIHNGRAYIDGRPVYLRRRSRRASAVEPPRLMPAHRDSSDHSPSSSDSDDHKSSSDSDDHKSSSDSDDHKTDSDSDDPEARAPKSPTDSDKPSSPPLRLMPVREPERVAAAAAAAASRPLSRASSSMQELEGLVEYTKVLNAMASDAKEGDGAEKRVAAAAAADAEEESESAGRAAKRARTDAQMQQQCDMIRELLPDVPYEKICEALACSDTPDEAISRLLDEAATSEVAVAERREKQAQQLLELLPKCTREDVLKLLNEGVTPDEAYERLSAAQSDECDMEERSRRCAVLAGRFPDLPFDVVRRAAMEERTEAEAAELLQKEDDKRRAERDKAVESLPLELLMSMFPEQSKEDVVRAFERCDFDVSATIDLLEDGFDARLAGKKPARLRRPRLSILGLGLDYTKPSQSLMNETELSVAEMVRRTMKTPYHVTCIKQMLLREQELHDDYVVFYHSYSHAALLYEVHAVLAMLLLDAPPNCPPLPRLLYKPFHNMPTVDQLLEHGAAGDHAATYRSCAISASNSIFATMSEAPPISCFVAGYSCMDLSFEALLTGVLAVVIPALGAPQRADLAKRICRLAQEYGLSTLVYKGMITSMGRPPLAESGHMLQIFIRRSEVDAVAYDSLPYGRYTGRGPISALLARDHTDLSNGQARVFVHPELLLNPRRALVFYYCANEDFANRRMEFRSKLTAILREQLPSSYEALSAASRRVRNVPQPEDE